MFLFKHNAAFRPCISKAKNTLIHKSEVLDKLLLMYNLLECSHNNSMTSGSLWNYYRDEIVDGNDGASDGKSFKYEIKIVEKTPWSPPQLENPGNAD